MKLSLLTSALCLVAGASLAAEKTYMGVNQNLSEKIVRNAKIALEASCQGKAGESVLILVDKDQQRVQCAQALEAGALELGMKPIIMDLSAYSGLVHDPSFVHNDQKYPTDRAELEAKVLKPARAAAEASDIVICLRSPGLTLTYANLFGVPHMDDICLTGKGRRMEYQYVNMENWNVTKEQVAAIRPRTNWLYEKLKTAKAVRITSPAGTDMMVPLLRDRGLKIYPIHGIVPFFGEVCIVPALGPGMDGTLVIDGSTYRGVRPPSETDREPLKFVLKEGRVVDMSGDPEQIARLKKLDEMYEPAGYGLDEVGLVTTDIPENDTYWTIGRFDNGTHSHNTIHIALGKNTKRAGVVHSNLHMDMDIQRPTVSVDGLVFIRDGKFVDSLLDPAPVNLDDETGFVPIFNGKNLDGWEGDTGTYFAENGLLQCRQKGKFGGGNLRTKKSYENFALRFEFKLPPEANNGVAIRCAPTARAATEGMEIQLLDDTAPYYWRDLKLGLYQYTGSIYGCVPAKRKSGFSGLDMPAKSTYLKPVGEWNEMEVRAEGEHITVHLNREKVVDADMTQFKGDGDTPDHKVHTGLHSLCGRIGWCGHGYNVQWRNIRVKELPPSPLRIDGRWAFDTDGQGAWLGLDDFEKTGTAQLLLLGGSPEPVKPERLADGSYRIYREWLCEGQPEGNIFREITFKPTNAEFMEVTFANQRGGLKPDLKPVKLVARRTPTLGRLPALESYEYGAPIDLLKDGLVGWEPKEKDKKSCWTFKDGVLENTGSGANLITKRRDFTDFKLSYDVRVDKGCNSGVYLRGIYELQVIDSCGKKPDSHNMAALYGRLTPKKAAEKPAGEWQHVDVILADRHLTVTLNDERIIDKERILGVTGGAITADEFVPGPMYLQGDHKGGAFRNMILTPIVNKGLR